MVPKLEIRIVTGRADYPEVVEGKVNTLLSQGWTLEQIETQPGTAFTKQDRSAEIIAILKKYC